MVAHGNHTYVNAFKTLSLTQAATRFSSQKKPAEKSSPSCSIFTPNISFFQFSSLSFSATLLFLNQPTHNPSSSYSFPFRFFHYFSPVSSSLLSFVFLATLYFFMFLLSCKPPPTTSMASHVFATRPCSFKHLKCCHPTPGNEMLSWLRVWEKNYGHQRSLQLYI